MVQAVSDSLSNANERIEHAAKVVARCFTDRSTAKTRIDCPRRIPPNSPRLRPLAESASPQREVRRTEQRRKGLDP